MQETQVWSLGWEDPMEKGMATHSSILAWRIPWTGEPGWLQPVGSQSVRHNWVTLTYTHTHTHTQFQKLKLYQEVLLPHSSHSYTPSINNYFDLSLFLSCKTNKKKLQMHECFLSLTKSSKLSILFWNFFHLIVYSECHSVFVEIFLIFKPFIVLCHGSQWIRTFSCLGI